MSYRSGLIAEIAAAIATLPPERQEKLRGHLRHDLPEETFVTVDSPRLGETIEGLVVGGERDHSGQWDLDGHFVVFSSEGDRFQVRGYNCDVTVLTADQEDEE